jgi:hypothetical protein
MDFWKIMFGPYFQNTLFQSFFIILIFYFHNKNKFKKIFQEYS